MSCHVGDDRARIDPATQKRTDRHIADHVHTNGLIDLFTELFDQILLSRLPVRFEHDIPVATRSRRQVRPGGEHMRRLELANSAENALGARSGQVGKEVVQRGPIELTLDSR